MPRGVVLKSTGKFYTVLLTTGIETTAVIRGKTRLTLDKSTNPIAVGDDVLLDSFEGDEKIAFDMVMNYAGENGTGLKIKEVLEEKINDKYPDQKIFDHEDTRVNISVEKYEPKNNTLFNYQVEFLFYPKGNSDFDLNYGWKVNIDDGTISGLDNRSTNIIQKVEYAD